MDPNSRSALGAPWPSPPSDAWREAPEHLLAWIDAAAPQPIALPGGLSTVPRLPEPFASEVRLEAARVLKLPLAELLAWLDATLIHPAAAPRLELARRLGLLAIALPEVDGLCGFHSSSPRHHKDLWAHTLQVLERTPAMVDLRWSALLHDVGKLVTRAVTPDGKVHFLRHEAVGAYLVVGIGARLAMPEARVARIAYVVEHHGRVNAYHKGWTDSAVRRLMREAGEHLPDLLAFSAADFTTKRTERAARIRACLAHLDARLARLRREDRLAQALPSGVGHAVREALGGAGPHLGRAMAWLREQATDGHLPADAAPELYVAALHERWQDPGPPDGSSR